MKNQNNSNELKTQIQHLVAARQSLQSNTDISGSMVKITKTLKNIQPLMTKQSQYIKNFLQGNESNDQSSKQSQTRRYISRISDIILNDLTQIFSAGQMFFTIDLKTNWTKLKKQFQKKLYNQRQQIDKNNIIQFLFKILNFRDQINKQIIKSFLYKKYLLWKDLNIVTDNFVHLEKKKLTKSIQDYITNKNYAPTRPVFALPDLEVSGVWSLNKQEAADGSLPQFFKLMNEEMEEVFNTVRNYSNLNQQQRNSKDIKRNDSQISSLRGEIEQAHINYQILQRKYRQAVSKDEKLDIVEMKQKLKIAEDAVESKDLQLRQLKYSYRDYTRDMNSQKQKIKQLQSDLQKVTNHQMKKLKQIQTAQQTLGIEFTRIYKNIGNLGTIFQFQSDGKKSLANEIIKLKQTIEKMAIILGRHKNEIHRLKQQMKRLNLIIIQLGLQLKDQNNKDK